MFINGYRIKGTTDLSLIETALENVSKKMSKKAEKLYHLQVGEEMAFLADNLALNIIQRNGEDTIYEAAVKQTDERIRLSAQMEMTGTYDYRCFVRVMFFNGDTYIQAHCLNEILLSAFEDLEPYSVSYEERKDETNEKNRKWTQILAAYENKQPLSMNLTPSVTPQKGAVILPDKKSRCQKMARSSILNHRLNEMSGGKNIPPFRMMAYMEEALEYLASEDGQREYLNRLSHLAQILPALTTESIFLFENL